MNNSQTIAPDSSMVTLTYIIYGLHLFSAATGVMTSALVVTAFLTGWPSIIAVIINYVKRGDVRGTYLDSHFEWQITTFWFALMWILIALLLMVTIVGIPLAILIFIGSGLWVLYRIIRGIVRLNDGLPMPN